MSTMIQPTNNSSSPRKTRKSLEVDAIVERNTLRKQVKSEATPGPWYVKVNTYRGAGTKYEVRRLISAKSNGIEGEEETIVPEGLFKKDKDFIAFARNDDPEKDIDLLLAEVERLRVFEASCEQMADRITQLEIKKQQLDARIATLESDKKKLQEEYQTYVRKTEELHLSAAILREGLEFYADGKNWEWQLVFNPILDDDGQKAREALAKSDSGKEVLEKVKALESAVQAAGHILMHDDQDDRFSPEIWEALSKAYAKMEKQTQ